MQRNKNIRFVLSALIFCSLMSSLFLNYSKQKNDMNIHEFKFSEIVVQEKSYLPDVKIVKEVLKSIFNVVKF